MKLFKYANIIPYLALAAALVASASNAHASSITYSLLGVTTSAGTLSGTVSIDSATDLVTSANITFHDVLVGNPVFNNIGSPNTYNELGQDYISGPSDSPLNYGGQMALYYDTANIGTGNLGICLAVGPCGTESNQASFVQVYANGAYGGPFNVTGGSLQRVGSMVAPEPSSLVLLGTGILGIAGFAQWKSRHI